MHGTVQLNKEKLVVDVFDNNSPGNVEQCVIQTCLTVHSTVQFNKKLVLEGFDNNTPAKVKQSM